MLFGGEAVNPHWVRHVLESGPPERLLHVYGPTECTTFATFYLVRHVPKDATTIPIGRPISNTTAYVLDRHRNPVPMGVPGELYLGGPGLAQGYVNRPELTREKFVADCFGADKSRRLYRTGDMVKYLPDGNIEFIGRADNQVKIRGFRIEPGEVEAVLRRHQGGGCSRRRAGGRAWRTPAGSLHCASERQRTRRLARLSPGQTPTYMIPSAFVELDALPMTASGKVDRLALPKPQRSYRREFRPKPNSLRQSRSSAMFGQTFSHGRYWHSKGAFSSSAAIRFWPFKSSWRCGEFFRSRSLLLRSSTIRQFRA